MNNRGIYKIQNKTNGKTYIGQSKNIKSRLYIHRRALRRNEHYNKHLQAAYNKHGEHQFIFEAIEICDETQFNEREIFWIEKLDTFQNGYNLTAGGNYRNYVCSPYSFEHIETGKVISGNNLKDFCIEQGIPLSSYSHFTEMMNETKKRNTCLGWRKSGTAHTTNKQKPFSIIHQSGETYQGSNLRQFARERKINVSNLIALIKGRQKSAYGWRLT